VNYLDEATYEDVKGVSGWLDALCCHVVQHTIRGAGLRVSVQEFANLEETRW
jgi:hypothetical protein